MIQCKKQEVTISSYVLEMDEEHAMVLRGLTGMLTDDCETSLSKDFKEKATAIFQALLRVNVPWGYDGCLRIKLLEKFK